MDSSFCAAQMEALSDATRLSVLQALMAGPRTVGELNDRLRMEQSLLSHHLKVLRDAKLVRTARQGKRVRYALAGRARSGRSLDLGCCRVSFLGMPGKK